ncbi:MAG: type II toxin-antitoxin system Phd/YefM family antitoxin [Fibromonadales bacterium]|nr:type II toxin-antitoxin system Phd/YefM family antitoxin [Fibromonadales bacterium]
MQQWQLQEAKTKFSEPVAVIVSIQKYRSLAKSKQSLHDFLSSSPLSDAKLRISRNTSATMRDIDL